MKPEGVLESAFSVGKPVEDRAETIEVSGNTYSEDTPFVNSIGMKFIPVKTFSYNANDGGVSKLLLFSKFETRRQDFREFAKEVQLEDTRWSGWAYQGHRQENDEHPVSYVSWQESRAFCDWLTRKEIASGMIPPNSKYRLPWDYEWSCAAGLRDIDSLLANPKEDHQLLNDEMKSAYLLEGDVSYSPANFGVLRFQNFPIDDYKITSPVGCFSANQFGLHDMRGNVAEWNEDEAGPVTSIWSELRDTYSPVDEEGVLMAPPGVVPDFAPAFVLRGGSWNSSSFADTLLGNRDWNQGVVRRAAVGFRVVLDVKN